MNRRARTQGASEVHGQLEIPAQEITQECTEVHAAEVHAPDPLFRGGGHPEEWEERLRIAVEATLRARAARKAERAEFKRRRDWGLAQRHAQKLARNRRAERENAMTRCRYLRRNGELCTAEAVAEDEDLIICSKHLARALELLQRKGIHLTTTKEN